MADLAPCKCTEFNVNESAFAMIIKQMSHEPPNNNRLRPSHIQN